MQQEDNGISLRAKNTIKSGGNIMADARTIINKLPEMFKVKKAKRYDRDIQLCVTGEGGGDFKLKILNQDLTIDEGKFDEPNITVTLATEDFIELFTGKTRAMNLLNAKKLEFEGGGMTEGIAFMSIWDIPKP